MNSKVSGLLGFLIGAAGGSLVTYLFAKKKYEDKANEDFEARRAAAKEERQKEASKTKPEVEKKETIKTEEAQKRSEANIHKPNLVDYKETLKKQGYTDYASMNQQSEEKPFAHTKPYVISSEEGGTKDNYEIVDLIYFADGTLTDDGYDPVDDYENKVGEDFEDYFGDGEDGPDEVWVRNDVRQIDYDITRDLRIYDDAKEEVPPHISMEE